MPAAVQTTAPSTTRRRVGRVRPMAALAMTRALTQFEPCEPPTARMATDSPTTPISPAHGTSPGIPIGTGKMSRLVSTIMAAVAAARNVTSRG